jgi:hypothetical protein
VKGMALSREGLDRHSSIVQADTIRRWHRELVRGNRYTNNKQKTGRPPTDPKVVELVLRMARENVSWGVLVQRCFGSPTSDRNLNITRRLC